MSMSVANSSTYLNQPARGESGGSGKGFMGNKTGLEKKLLALVAVLALVVIGLIIGLAVEASKKEKTIDNEVCNTNECVVTAAYFLERMNVTASPCDDFYNFVCGKWEDETRIPDQKGRYGVFDDLRDDLAQTCVDNLEMEVTESVDSAIAKAKLYYQSCIATESISKDTGISQLKELLNLANLSPDLNDTNKFNLFDTLPMIVRNLGLNFILNFNVEADDKNTTLNIIALDQPLSFVLNRNILVGSIPGEERVKAYTKYIQDSLCLLQSDSEGCVEIPDITQKIYNFEVEMAKLTRDQVERRSAWTLYFPMPLSQLNSNVPKIDFLKFIKDILGPEKSSNIDLSTIVIAKEVTYFKSVSELLDKTPKSTISNYLTWRIIQSLGPSLFKEFRDIKFEFDKVNGGITKPEENKIRCFDSTNSALGHAVGRIYVNKKFDESSKKDVEDMVHNLADAFRELVDYNNWMDMPTKEASKEKLHGMNSMIGYPDWTTDDTKLNTYYQNAKMIKEDFFTNMKNILKVSVEESLAKLTKTNNRKTDWISPASIVNAFYNPSANSITFPAGILQLPFYGKRAKALNYGAIGYVIGHEITHGYDDQGSQYDSEGNLFNWWSNDTSELFNQRKECFIKQYSDITDQLSGMNLKGNQTIGENIADNGGIRESYKAYVNSGRVMLKLPGMEEYDDLQLFYISAASVWCTKFRKAEMENQINGGVHSPGKYRAYIPLANSEEFAQVFNCPRNSVMNPQNRCVIW